MDKFFFHFEVGKPFEIPIWSAWQGSRKVEDTKENKGPVHRKLRKDNSKNRMHTNQREFWNPRKVKLLK